MTKTEHEELVRIGLNLDNIITDASIRSENRRRLTQDFVHQLEAVRKDMGVFEEKSRPKQR